MECSVISRPALSPRTDAVSQALARNRLGVFAVVIFVMSAAAPLTVVAGVLTTGYAVTGLIGIPLAFLAVGVVVALFSVGYVAMARHVSNAGAFYAFVARGLGRPVGVAAAWVALLAYSALQVALYGAIGAAAAPLLQEWFGLRVGWWVIALAAWLLVAVLGLLRVDLNGIVLAVLLVAEIAVIVVFSGASLLWPADGGGLTFDGLAPSNLAAPGVGAVLVLAVLGFVGFEQSVVFSEESRDPVRTVPTATYVAVTLIAGLYAFAAWAMTLGTGPASIVDRSRAEGPEVLFNVAGERLGGTSIHIGHALFLTSIMAAMISFHATTARYAFALGRENVLPKKLGDTSQRTGAPKVGSLLQSLCGLAVIVVYAVAGWDPLVHLFFWGGTGGGFGVLLLIAVTALAVIAFFARQPSGESAWRRLVAPGLAAVALLVIVALALVNFDVLLGVDAHSRVRWIIPGTYLLVALAGVGWALLLRAGRPAVYRRIGTGAKAATSTLTATRVPVRTEGRR
jgi:amino acid transporter